MNYIDFIILLFVVLYGIYGYFRGFLKVFSDLLFLFISLFFAFVLNNKFSSFLSSFISILPNLLKVLSFLLLLSLFEIIFALLSAFIYSKMPEKAKEASWNKFLGIFPSVLRGIFFTAVSLIIFVSLPISGEFKNKILSSKIGKPLVSQASGIERRLESVFGGAINETFTLLTIKPQTDESVDLKFKTSEISIDEESERIMLELLNKERVKRGLKPLALDTKIREVARAHSKDMFENGYFAHDNLKGESPFDRMEKAGVKFLVAGENLALAPNVDLAHQGLMESPGHRANILNSEFGKVGIGIQDGGIYGKMFTQNFTD